MHRRLYLLLSVPLLLAACEKAEGPDATTTGAVAVEEAQGTPLPIDTAASEIGFRGVKVTGGHDGGFHEFEGTVTATDTAVTGVDLTIRMPSVWTDNERLSNHLRGGDFFLVERFPTATFTSAKIVRADTAGATHLVTGNLTMRGVTQGVTFPATIVRTPEAATARATFVIDRTRWGIAYKGQADNLISNDVSITFDVTARAAGAPASETPTAVAPTAGGAATSAPDTATAQPQR